MQPLILPRCRLRPPPAGLTETLLDQQLATMTAAMEEALNRARAVDPDKDEYGHRAASATRQAEGAAAVPICGIPQKQLEVVALRRDTRPSDLRSTLCSIGEILWKRHTLPRDFAEQNKQFGLPREATRRRVRPPCACRQIFPRRVAGRWLACARKRSG